jgi:hypothetical protein
MGWDDMTHLTGLVVGFMVLNGLCNSVLSDYLWARAIVLTSPTVATIGVSITIPLAMISDFIIHGRAPTATSGFGAFLVVVGFVLVNITLEYETEVLLYLRGGHPYEELARSAPKADSATSSPSLSPSPSSSFSHNGISGAGANSTRNPLGFKTDATK